MAVGVLSRLAARAVARVFPCIGPGTLPAVERLFGRPGLRRADSPREAAIMLVAGDIPERAQEALSRVHDQLPHPRATFRWDGRGNPEPALIDLWRALVTGRESEPDQMSDAPPNEWRGVGDHGQGGEGMMGGTPYGRPMAMTGADMRDGLMLDAYTARVGPFAPMLPGGLALEVTLQGDVIAAVQVQAPPFEQPEEAADPALCAARLLRLLGLDGDAGRLLRGASPRGFGALRAIPPGLGAAGPGEDVRARLGRWLGGQPGTYQAPALPDLLAGAEWHEAMLVLNSFPPDAIRRACLEGEPA